MPITLPWNRSTVLLFCACVAAVNGCSSSEAETRVIHPVPPRSGGSVPPRHYLFAHVDSIQWSGVDHQLDFPSSFAVSAKGFVIQDGTTRLVALSLKGRYRWSHDLRDNAVTHIGDWHLLPGDTVIVLDSPGERLLRIEPTSQALSTIALTGVGKSDTFVPLPGGLYIALTSDSLAPLVEFDNRGTLLARRPFPWVDFARLNPLARQGYAAGNVDTDRWGFTFAFADGFFVFDGLVGRPFTGHGVVPVPFPEVIERRSRGRVEDRLAAPTDATVSAAVSGDILFILFAGDDAALRSRVVDEYSLVDGTYRGSLRLPAKSLSISVRGDHLYALTREDILDLTPAR
jgi:hypothetical protein